MGSASITLSKCTWYQVNDSTNHLNPEWLRITRETSGGSTLPYYAVIQFAIPSQLKYKKINKAYVRYYSRWTSLETYSGYNGMKVAPYLCDGNALDYLTGASIDSYGVRGEWVTVEAFSDYGEPFPKWRSSDITSIFSSNIYNDAYFTLIFSGFPGFPWYDLYGEIAGWEINHLPTLEIDYSDVEQLAPDPSYPVGAYVSENTDLLFSWSWRAETKAVQAAVQLEYKLASAQSWTVVSLTQTTHTYTLSGGLPQGAYQWRIKGTNDAGETSGYSETAEFTVIGKPAAPVINTPANKALTEITWEASDQNSYDITLTDSNSVVLINETVASSVASYKPQMLLKGSYTVGIRYRNSSGLSSDWTYKTFTINASGPSTPAMQLYGDGETVKVIVTLATSTDYVLMRAEDDGNNDYAIVGKFSGASFIDDTFKLNTPYAYKVRAYASGGYTDSAVERYKCESERVVLQASDKTLILSKSENEFLPYAEDSKTEMAVFRCPGRRYPVVEHSEVDSWIFSSSLFVTEAEKDTLKEIAKEDYIWYRDYSGRAFPVAIQTLAFNRYMNEGYTANIEFVRIAEREVVINV